MEKIPIGISACILGREVRYNGGHKLDRYIRETLGAYMEFVAVCPEVDIGLGVPRDTLRLIRDEDGAKGSIRLVAPKSGSDHTQKMQTYARKKAKALGSESLCGFIVQKGSPSCGMERVRIYTKPGVAPATNGRGLFTQALMERYPNLPVEEDGRLNDPGLRENFIERVFAYKRLRAFFAGRWSTGKLVPFHSHEKLLLLAHDRKTYTALGRLVAKAKEMDRKALAAEYESLFMACLGKKASRGKHANVLQHIAGYFKKQLGSDDRKELQEIIENYRLGQVPLVVPITMMRHYIRKFGVGYLAEQSYLEPHPVELMLRNHG